MNRRPRRVVIVLPQHVHLLDVAGPAQVFVSAGEAVDGLDGGPAYDVAYVATPGTVAHQGLPLAAATTWPELEGDDLVVVPGWKTQRTLTPLTDELAARVRGHWDAGGHVASVCGGALLLAQLDILRGQRATTHHDLVDALARFRDVSIVHDVLFTCSGRLHTSAGIASGIDLALHLVAADHGPSVAARVARTLVVPAWRPGGASQASIMLQHRGHLDDLTHRAQDLLEDPASPALALDQVAARLGVSGRTLARRFTAAVGMTPHAYQTAVRRERAAELVARGWTRGEAARAVGYADARSLRA
ncbi:DJ-1/PfpI family protein [Mariniluteicoccus endophyticus]